MGSTEPGLGADPRSGFLGPALRPLRRPWAKLGKQCVTNTWKASEWPIVMESRSTAVFFCLVERLCAHSLFFLDFWKVK